MAKVFLHGITCQQFIRFSSTIVFIWPVCSIFPWMNCVRCKCSFLFIDKGNVDTWLSPRSWREICWIHCRWNAITYSWDIIELLAMLQIWQVRILCCSYPWHCTIGCMRLMLNPKPVLLSRVLLAFRRTPTWMYEEWWCTMTCEYRPLEYVSYFLSPKQTKLAHSSASINFQRAVKEIPFNLYPQFSSNRDLYSFVQINFKNTSNITMSL